MGDRPSPEATYERARRLANIAMWTIDLQRRRIKSGDPIDEKFVFRRLADFDFLVVALTRLRRAATIAAKVAAIKAAISVSLQEFDRALPNLKQWRDVAEHIDDYAVDSGRRRHVGRKSLEVSTLSGATLEWLGTTLNADDAVRAAKQLFKAIQTAGAMLPKR